MIKIDKDTFEKLVETVGFSKEDHYAIYPMLRLLFDYTVDATLDSAASECREYASFLRAHRDTKGADIVDGCGTMIAGMKSSPRH